MELPVVEVEEGARGPDAQAELPVVEAKIPAYQA